MALEKQEIYCHNCGGYVSFALDMSLDGNHVLTCPKCGHEHCRVVKDGVITSERWDRRNGQTYPVSTGTITYTAQSTSSGSTALFWACTGSL